MPAFEVHWASSNGALYLTEPLHNGLHPWADFWMGWEDLAYGWLLESKGYSQWVVTGAVLDDDYEYAERQIGGTRVSVSDKPAWYSYYHARNLWLAAVRTRADVPRRATVVLRVAAECGVTLALRTKKRERLALLLAGLRDGLFGLSGKGRVP